MSGSISFDDRPQHFRRQVEGTQQMLERNRKRFAELLDATRKMRDRLNLRTFLRLLICDQCCANDEFSIESGLKLAETYDKEVALARVLEKLALGKKVALPEILRGSFELSELRQAVKDHRNEVARAKRVNRIGNPNYDVSVNWRGYAERLRMGKSTGEPLAVHRDTPWERVVGKLIGKCSLAGINESFIREWIMREGEYDESDPRAAELERLSNPQTLYELIQFMRSEFPKEADEWFGPAFTAPPEIARDDIRERASAVLNGRQQVIFDLLWEKRTATFQKLGSLHGAWTRIPASDVAIEKQIKRMRKQIDTSNFPITISVSGRRVNLERPI